MLSPNSFRKTLDFIKENPNMWDQAHWGHGKETHCFLGWLLINEGLWNGQPYVWPSKNLYHRVSDLLGIGPIDTFWLSEPKRTIDDFEFYYTNEKVKL